MGIGDELGSRIGLSTFFVKTPLFDLCQSLANFFCERLDSKYLGFVSRRQHQGNSVGTKTRKKNV